MPLKMNLEMNCWEFCKFGIARVDGNGNFHWVKKSHPKSSLINVEKKKLLRQCHRKTIMGTSKNILLKSL